MKIEFGNDCIQYFEKQNKGLRLRFSMCFLQKNCTRINTFMYNIWQQISIYKVNTTFNTFWLCNLKLPCLVVGSSFDSYLIMSIAYFVHNFWTNLSISCHVFLKQPSKCLQDISTKLLHAPMMIGIVTTFLTFHNFATSLLRSSYFSLFSSSLSITLPSNGHETSMILHSFFSLSCITMSGRL